MRVLILFLAVLAGCGPAPQPSAAQPPADPTTEPWYNQTVAQLTSLNQEAESLLKEGKSDAAAARITKSQPLVNRLVGVPHPTLSAMEAASDSDDLYGRMLLANHNYGWARLLFQKNRARWKLWKPQTPETERRRKRAEEQIAETDRRMTE